MFFPMLVEQKPLFSLGPCEDEVRKSVMIMRYLAKESNLGQNPPIFRYRYKTDNQQGACLGVSMQFYSTVDVFGWSSQELDEKSERRSSPCTSGNSAGERKLLEPE